jgi:hypothetical protein
MQCFALVVNFFSLTCNINFDVATQHLNSLGNYMCCEAEAQYSKPKLCSTRIEVL